mgnify:FL=1
MKNQASVLGFIEYDEVYCEHHIMKSKLISD